MDNVDRIKSILCEILEMDINTNEIINDEDLTERGLDSIKSIELVVNLENYFNIMIDDDDLYIENLLTIDKICEVVIRNGGIL